MYPLGDEESPVYNQISMESETCSSHSTTDDGREDEGRTAPSEPGFPSYLSCRGCGQLRDGPLGPGIDLVGPYCLRCCKASREAKPADFCPSFAGISGIRAGSHAQLEAMANGMADKSLSAEDKLAKQHSCHLCGFSSRYANHVKRHMKTHNGEKPYHCPLCTYASAQLVNLQRHLRIHTGEKPYKCDSCTFACSSLGNLKRHQRMHVQGAGQEAAVSLPISQKRQMSGQRSNEDISNASKGRLLPLRPPSPSFLDLSLTPALTFRRSFRSCPGNVKPGHGGPEQRLPVSLRQPEGGVAASSPRARPHPRTPAPAPNGGRGRERRKQQRRK